MNFLVWEMSLLHFLAMIKEVAVGGATSSILYNELPKEIIIARGLDSYRACRLHKYGWPNNTSQTSRGNITQYLICEGLDVVGKAALLANSEISSLVKPPDTVRLWVWCSQ